MLPVMGNAPAIVVGFWRRFAADIIDALVLGAFGWAIGYPLRYWLSELGERAAWFGLVVSLLYAGVLQARFGRGQTIGKRALGIQVLRRDGEFLGLLASFSRYLVVSFVFYNGMYGSLLMSASPRVATVVGSIFLFVVVGMFFGCFLMIPLHPLKRGLHDLVCGSIVVYRGRYDAAALASLENPRRARTAIALTGLSAVLLFGIALWTLASALRGANLKWMASLRDELAKDYNVTKVNAGTFNGAHRTLTVDVWVPLRLQENETRRENLRTEILARTQAIVPANEQFEAVRVGFNSGFRLGIANMTQRR